MKIIYIILLSIFLIGCKTTSKIQNKTTIEKVIEIDTVLVIKYDTVTKIKTVKLTDTLYLENNTSKVKTYYDFKKEKIVSELTGKQFNLPIKINQKIRIVNENKEVNKKDNFKSITILMILLSFIIILKLKLKL